MDLTDDVRALRADLCLFDCKLARGVQKLRTFACGPPLTYAVWIVPAGAFPTRRGWKDESPKFNIDFVVAEAAYAARVMRG